MQLPDVIEYGGKNSLCSGRTGGIGFYFLLCTVSEILRFLKI
jgi:hypothetical protein